MIAISRSADELRRQWRQQILTHLDPRSVAARKGFVALTFVDRANASSVFVDISHLSVVLLYEDESHRHDRAPLRFCGYRVSRVPHGVQWGGAEHNQLYKDLTLVPKRGARGRRLDVRKHELLTLALKLDCRLSRAARHRAAPWPGLRLPRLWAGFRNRYTRGLDGHGPEFEEACRAQSATAAGSFANSAQQLDGLTLYPVDWVSDQLERATAVFAEMTVGLRRQLFRVAGLPDGLIGFQGASAYDFYNSRFRTKSHQRQRDGHGKKTTRATTEKSRDEGRLLEAMSVIA